MCNGTKNSSFLSFIHRFPIRIHSQIINNEMFFEHSKENQSSINCVISRFHVPNDNINGSLGCVHTLSFNSQNCRKNEMKIVHIHVMLFVVVCHYFRSPIHTSSFTVQSFVVIKENSWFICNKKKELILSQCLHWWELHACVNTNKNGKQKNKFKGKIDQNQWIKLGLFYSHQSQENNVVWTLYHRVNTTKF